jgi:hypothetical protein
MPDKPVPLREALAEAVVAMVTLASDFIPHETEIEAEYRQQAERAGALIDQIPLVFRAREGDGE